MYKILGDCINWPNSELFKNYWQDKRLTKINILMSYKSWKCDFNLMGYLELSSKAVYTKIWLNASMRAKRLQFRFPP